MIKYIITYLLLLFTVGSAYSQIISISLFHNKNPDAAIVTIQNGFYHVFEDNRVIDSIDAGANISISISADNKIEYRHDDTTLYIEGDLFLKSDLSSSFFINYLGSEQSARCYEGYLKFFNNNGRLMIINFVELEAYVAAVVETEGGYNAPQEFYKVQSILSRTYALRNMSRHAEERFNLCDGMHCQAYRYKAMCSDIIEASKKTENLVLVDDDTNLIDALYHSNSGGQTLNSGDVWMQDLPYLKSVKDDYAKYGRNYYWEDRIKIYKWKEYLFKNGVQDIDDIPIEDLAVIQNERKPFFYFAGVPIRVSKIRNDFGLRSSFFNMEIDGNYYLLKGKGYGHGVGLSQESAIAMAGKDYSYSKIINFFFNDVNVVNINILSVFDALKQQAEREIP